MSICTNVETLSLVCSCRKKCVNLPFERHFDLMTDILENKDTTVKRTVLDVEDIARLAPPLASHPKLIERLIHWLEVDKVNAVHSKFFDTPGPEFVKHLIEDFRITLKVDNAQVLDSFPEGVPFVTVSNHPFGALDGIVLIYLVSSRRPEYKVMVNMILNHLTAMRPNFIAVDALASDDPAKKAVSMRGIKEAIMQIRRGNPVGFFPAGAVSKLNRRLRLEDRQWQPSIIRLIEQLGVPVVPIFFHGSNSAWFNFLGLVSWQLRTLRLPAEVFRKCGTTMHISVGDPISVDEQRRHQGSVEEFGDFLKQRTYALRSIH